MDAYLDRLLDELVAAQGREAWHDVLDRARRSRRRYLVAVALVAALILVPTSWGIAQAFQGTPAPPTVKADLRFGNKMRAEVAKTLGRKEPKAIASKAHGVIQVQTADGPINLWAAPATDGGTCYLIAWQSGLGAATSSCVPATATPANSDGGPHNLVFSTQGDYAHRNYNIVNGYAYGGATTVRVTLSNGKTKTLPVVEGLFLGALRQSTHWRLRPKIVSVVAHDAHGQVVGSWRRAGP
jgi:hypothetical protein